MRPPAASVVTPQVSDRTPPGIGPPHDASRRRHHHPSRRGTLGPRRVPFRVGRGSAHDHAPTTTHTVPPGHRLPPESVLAGMDIRTALRSHDGLAAFTAAGRHGGDVELWVRDAVRDRR
ncbi:hypothetical protein GCM10010390_83590 [Streptomyces mordarskii]|uniref:Uncharacterized protein n=1 Tax=Streptomyces mordarskii TaxID=1226758 RepID=A0ABN1EJX1_9ACTN